ncbi:MAG: hypothetical protein WBD95_22365, partial [Xanthobacteraceae bacterium]
HHDYTNLYSLLNSWRAAHLQNSVWLAELNLGAQATMEAMRAHMHNDDTICVIELPASGAAWWSANCRQEGINWLKARFP